MSISHAQLLQILLALLTPNERAHAIAYLAEQVVVAGTVIENAREPVAAPWDAVLAFVDQDPSANWSHACRYILINPQTGETQSVEGRFPMFSMANPGPWRLAYKAPALPDSLVLVPQSYDRER